MENKKKGSWKMRRIISWILTVVMVVSTFAYGGIPSSRVEAASYSVSANIMTLSVGDILAEDTTIDSLEYYVVYVDGELLADPENPGNPYYYNYTYTVDQGTLEEHSVTNPSYKTTADFYVDNVDTHRLDLVTIKSLSSANTSIEGGEHFIFDGTEKAPVIMYAENATDEPVALVEGTDYEVSNPSSASGTFATKATEAGKYAFKVNGIGKYTGSLELTWDITYKIVGGEEGNTSLSISEFVYNGKPQAPDVMFTPLPTEENPEPEPIILKKDVDYTVNEGSTVSATDINDYKISLKGTGNYSGEAELEWSIIPIELTSENTSLDQDDFIFNREEQGPKVQYTYTPEATEEEPDPEPVTVDLVAGTDYTVVEGSKDKATNAGSYTLSIVGTGIYGGEQIDLAWKITPITLTSDNTKVVEEEYDYDGEEKAPKVQYTYTPEPTEEVPDPEPVSIDLKPGSDFDYTLRRGSTEKETVPGDYQLRVSGKNNYTGNVDLSWMINEVPPVAVEGLIYNAEPQELIVAGIAKKGHQYRYRIGNRGNWSTSVPTATAAGDYEVQYRYYLGTGRNANYDRTKSGTLNVTIEKIPVTVTPALNQSKVYGIADSIFTYTVVTNDTDEVQYTLPAADFTDGMFKKGILGHNANEGAKKEDVGTYAFTLGTLAAENPSYDITLGTDDFGEDITFEITRKQLTDDDILIEADGYSDYSEEKGFEFKYTGKTVETAFYVYYGGREVDEDGNPITATVDVTNPSDEFLLVDDQDYVFSGETTDKNVVEGKTHEVNFRGENNFQGNIGDKWSVVLEYFEVKETAYEGEYDGAEHAALEVHPSPSRKYESEEKTIEYVLLPTDTTIDDILDFIFGDEEEDMKSYEDLWIAYAGEENENASSEAPMIKDVNLDEEGNVIPYIVLYKVHMNGYYDVIGWAEATITKRPIVLTADEPESKVYDKDPETDPELTYQDIADQVAEGEEIDAEDIVISREEGQDVGEYEISFNIDELNANEKYKNYTFSEETAYFEITKRDVKVRIGDYEKVYSEPLPEITVEMDKAGDEGVAENEGVIGDDEVSYELRFVKGYTRVTGDSLTDVGTYDIEFSRRNNVDNNYNLIIEEGGTLTIHPKDITSESITVLYKGNKGDEENPAFLYTGYKIEPDIVINDFIEDTNYMKNGRELAEGGPRKPDYRMTGVEFATDMGYYELKVEGLNNYTGTMSIHWFILPFDLTTSAVYNGLPQSPEYKDGFDPEDYKDFFTIKFYHADTDTYSEDMPEFTDVKRNADTNRVEDYDVNYVITYNAEEYGSNGGEDKTFEFLTHFTVEPYPLTVQYFWNEDKIYDGTTTVPFEGEIDALVDEEHDIDEGSFTVSFDADLDSADSNDTLYAAGELDYDDDLRPVTINDEQKELATYVITEGSTANASNYEIEFVEDEDGYLVDVGAVVNRKVLKSDPDAKEGDAFMNGIAEDREYDGTRDVNAEIIVSTGVDGDEILFNDAYADIYDAGDNGDVIIDDDGNPVSREVWITGKAEGVGETKLTNYAYESEDGIYPLEDLAFDDDLEETEFWAGHINGEVTISPAELTLKSEKFTKDYDGKVVTAADIDFEIAGLETIQDETAEYYLAHKDTALDFRFASSPKNAGEYSGAPYVKDAALKDMLEAGNNYKLNAEAASVLINPRPITVTVKDAAKVYGEADPTFTYTVENIVSGETLKNVKVSRKTGEEAGTYTLTAKCDANANYKITFVDGKLTINKKAASTTPSASAITVIPDTGKNGNGIITGVNDTMEYSTDGGKTWTSVPKGATSITGLPAGKVLIRVKETANYQASAAVEITVPARDKASSEWLDGQWYEEDGSATYQPKGSWKQDATGWWYEDTSGWYPVSKWQKIDGKWYYFTETGYMDYSEYRDGCWLGSDGAWVEEYYGGHWCSDSKGWWYEDASGWYPVSQYLWIDGTEYWFGADGYWKE